MRKIILFGLIASIVVYFILLVLFFRVNRKISDSFNLVEVYISEIEQVRALELRVRKIENDVRAYMLSGDTTNITDLNSDMARIDTCVTFVSRFVRNEPVQIARANELERLVQRRKELFAMSLQRFERGELKIDNIIRLTRSQSAITRDMQAVLKEIAQDEYKFLENEKRSLRGLKTQSYVLAASAGSLPLLITFFTIYFLTGLIKERDKIERRLSKLLENKDRFLAIIGHDLKGPAGAIKLMAQVLIDQNDRMNEEQQLKMKERLLSATTNQLKLLEDLIAWAKTQTNTMEYDPAVIDLHTVVENAILQMTVMAMNKNIFISHSINSSTIVFADEKMVQTVIRNLLQNAVKFTPHNGSIHMKCRTIDGRVEVAISDTGIGMPANKVSKLFSPGSHVSSKGTDGEPGTGLGLILCKEFVKKHGGRIWVESLKGKGSVFYFTLPLPK